MNVRTEGENAMKTLNVALAAAWSLVAPSMAMAATPSIQNSDDVVAVAPAQHARERIELRVSTAGFDLSNPQSVERLRSHITKAIETACKPTDPLNTKPSPDWQCRHEMGASATAALSAMARRAAPTALASN